MTAPQLRCLQIMQRGVDLARSWKEELHLRFFCFPALAAPKERGCSHHLGRTPKCLQLLINEGLCFQRLPLLGFHVLTRISRPARGPTKHEKSMLIFFFLILSSSLNLNRGYCFESGFAIGDGQRKPGVPVQSGLRMNLVTA